MNLPTHAVDHNVVKEGGWVSAIGLEHFIHQPLEGVQVCIQTIRMNLVQETLEDSSLWPLVKGTFQYPFARSNVLIDQPTAQTSHGIGIKQ